MCNAIVENEVAIVDLSKCPYEFGSPEFLNLHLKDLSTIGEKIRRIRYEEEIIIELEEEKTAILTEYANTIRQIESLLLRSDIYGRKEDENYTKRRAFLREVYEYLFMNPLMVERMLSEYNEPTPEKQIYMKGYLTFKAWVKGILKRFRELKLYKLTKQLGDLRKAFLSLTGLKSLYYVDTITLDIPKNARPLKEKEANYELRYGLKVQIYELPESDSNLYVIKNPYLENLSDELKKMLKRHIMEQSKEDFPSKNYEIMFELKTKEYRQYFLDQAVMNGIKITPEEAMAMAREAAAWVVGLGAPIENIALDNKNITDIYIDGENSPIYVEHRIYGVCHTLYRYNHELLQRAFKNIVLTEKGTRKFDEQHPIVDVVIKRLTMRCHLQRPPATFGELQGALRIMDENPFTYPKYFYYKSLTPFFAGYDDVMVVLGCSEAVLGLKSSGKTAFTTSKIISIGTQKRIIPIEDIEEVPVRAFRKRGFHIDSVRVQSSDAEVRQGNELDLVSMANALLRMGDAALIINEVRSRVAVQGIINLLNTQPGVFLLYNLHAESLKDIQDRLELVFGIPSISMMATDRYSFLDKARFGRKSRIYRIVGEQYETDQDEKKFVEVFKVKKGHDINSTELECLFLKNEEAKKRDLSGISMAKLEKELDINFIPPALKRRAAATSVSPEQYILQAFFKGKVFSDIYNAAIKTNNLELLEIDFVLNMNNKANRLLKNLENELGEVDFKEAEKEWKDIFSNELKKTVV